MELDNIAPPEADTTLDSKTESQILYNQLGNRRSDGLSLDIDPYED